MKGAVAGTLLRTGNVGLGKADMVAERDLATCITEYGVQTATSKTILTVTLDLAEAERTLEMIGGGRLLQRTVRYSPWTAVDEEAAAEPGRASSSS